MKKMLVPMIIIMIILSALNFMLLIKDNKIMAMNEIKALVNEKETAEAIGRAILMEHFPGSVNMNSELRVTIENDIWQVKKVIRMLLESPPGMVMGGGCWVKFRKTDCMIVELNAND